MTVNDGYARYRGTCKYYADYLAAMMPNLRVVRGHYFDPVWGGEEPHWWCVDPEDGAILDPSRFQFPTQGIPDFYTEFDGNIECEQCGKIVPEEDAYIDGHHTFCSTSCFRRCVGV